MYPIDSSNLAINAMYAGMSSEIASMPSKIVLNNAEDYTGLSSARESILEALAKNKEDAEALEGNAAFLQTTEGKVKSIADIVDEMKELAEKAASGDSTSEEIAEMQTQIGNLLVELDNEAKDPTNYFGQFDFLTETTVLTEDGGAISLALSSKSAHQLIVESTNATPEGLGIENIDLTEDTAGALNNLNAAAQELSEYGDYLETKADSLAVAAVSIDLEGRGLEAVEYAIESMDAAMVMVNTLSGNSDFYADVLLLAQANTTSDTVLQLLSDT